MKLTKCVYSILTGRTVPLILSLGASTVAVGSSGRSVPLPERLHGADRVVVAMASSVTAEWRQNQYGDRLIVSRVVLEVEEALKGSAEARVFMELEGGTLDGLTLRVSDLPQVHAGERGVFLLDRAGSTHVPHERGLGILKLDPADRERLQGIGLRLADVRRMARGER